MWLKFLFSWGKTRQGWGKTRPRTVLPPFKLQYSVEDNEDMNFDHRAIFQLFFYNSEK